MKGSDSTGDNVRVRPFRGLRYAPDRVNLAAVTAEPLASTDTLGIAAALSSDEHNVTWLLDPLLAGASSPDDAVQVARRLQNWCSSGILRHDSEPAMYVYRYRRGARALLGLVAAVALHEPYERRVLEHERVNQGLVARHVSLLQATAAQPEPVVMIHHAGEQYRQMLDRAAAPEPAASFRVGATEHSLWSITDPVAITALADLVRTEELLIADGHHRYAAFRLYRQRNSRPDELVRPWEFGLAMLVDAGDPGLTLGPVHRVMRDVTWADIRATPGIRVQPLGDAKTAAAVLAAEDAAEAGRCVVTDGARWLALKVTGPPDISGKPPGLAVVELHASWRQHWGSGEADIDYVHDAERAVGYARRSSSLAVLLPALPLELVFDAARRGVLLPAKTTSFGPKPRIGMVMRHWAAGLNDLQTTGSSDAVTPVAAGGAPG